MKPQPWLADDGARVRGTQLDLTGDLAHILSLEEETMPARRALIAMAEHLHHATLVGNPAPIVADARRRIAAPRVGDLVVEWSSGFRSARHERGDWYRAIGILVLSRVEWASTDEEWRAALADDEDLEPSDRGTDTATYIQYGTAMNDVCRWVNSEFLMVPFEAAHLAWV